MSTYTKKLLSASTNGLPVEVAATAIASGTLIHTATSVSGAFDEIYLWISNTDTADHEITLGWGAVTDPGALVSKTVKIPGNSGPTPYVMGMLVGGGVLIKAAADAANVLNLTGYVNSIAP